MHNIIVLNNKSNTLLIKYKNKGLLIDTGYDIEDTRKIIDYLKEENIELEIVIVSHYHKDHIQGVDLISQTFCNIKFYSSDITKFAYENEWFEEEMYENLVDIHHSGNITFNILKENLNFYGINIFVKNSNGHCRGNLVLKIENYLFCPDIILSNSDYLPFMTDVSSYINEIKKLREITDIDRIVLTHNKKVLSLVEFHKSLDNTKRIIEESINKIFNLIKEESTFDEVLFSALLSNIHTNCFTSKMSDEQLGYTIFVIKNILKYLKENNNLKIKYKNDSFFIERINYD